MSQYLCQHCQREMEEPIVTVTNKESQEFWKFCSQSCLLFFMMGRSKLVFAVRS
jgi:hypothetical protein